MKLPSAIRFLVIVIALFLGGQSLLFSTTIYRSEFYLKSAKQDQEEGDFEKAISNINKAILLTPANALLYREQATTYFYLSYLDRLNGYRDKTLAAMNKAIAINPERGDFYYTLGAFHLAFEQIDEAKTALKTALSFQPDHMSYRLGLAKLYLANKQWDKGFELYYETLSLKPKERLQKEAFRQLFAIYRKLVGDEAINFQQQILKLPLQLSDAQNMLKRFMIIGERFVKQGNSSQAFTMYYQAVALIPYHFSVKQKLLAEMLTISHQWREEQEYVKANQAYQQILSLLSSESGEMFEQRYRLNALLYLGVTQKWQHNFTGAEKTFQQLLATIPEQGGKVFEQNHRKAALLHLASLSNHIQ